MHLTLLKLTNFKNYEAQQLVLSPQLNCFVGQNGMGKTNLLDAIYYLCMCKSHFGQNDRYLVRHGENFFRLEGHFLQPTTDKKSVVVAKVQPKKIKTFEHNQLIYSRLSDHIGQFPVVMIAPDDTLMATEGSEERRRFIDNTLCQLNNDYLRQLIQYNRILEQRNQLLKQFAEARVFDALLIESYDRQIAPLGKAVFEARTQWASAFEPLFKTYYAAISNQQEAVRCTYQSKLENGNFAELLQENLERDRILQRTTVGIHRDDLELQIDNFPLKRFASQGQLKSFVLALKLAQYELLRQKKDITPILLLDDIFDKLDAQRVKQLLELLLKKQTFGQVFITDTHPDRIEAIVQQFDVSFERFMIQNGRVN